MCETFASDPAANFLMLPWLYAAFILQLPLSLIYVRFLFTFSFLSASTNFLNLSFLTPWLQAFLIPSECHPVGYDDDTDANVEYVPLAWQAIQNWRGAKCVPNVPSKYAITFQGRAWTFHMCTNPHRMCKLAGNMQKPRMAQPHEEGVSQPLNTWRKWGRTSR